MNNKTQFVNFTVSIEEANKIFKALGNLPFNEVYELIGKLNDQANQQLSQRENLFSSFLGDSSPNVD